jgi:hypothetical protein
VVDDAGSRFQRGRGICRGKGAAWLWVQSEVLMVGLCCHVGGQPVTAKNNESEWLHLYPERHPCAHVDLVAIRGATAHATEDRRKVLITLGTAFDQV